jgi:hypothetical protein
VDSHHGSQEAAASGRAALLFYKQDGACQTMVGQPGFSPSDVDARLYFSYSKNLGSISPSLLAAVFRLSCSCNCFTLDQHAVEADGQRAIESGN